MGLRFLVIVVLIYLIVIMMHLSMAVEALHASVRLLAKILPVFGFVFALMVLMNLFMSPKTNTKYLGKTAGWKRWVVSIISGIISTGPIYLWYALLKDLLRQGVSEGVVAAFLYARAIKPFLLPLMIFYFGWEYTAILTFVMVFASLLQGVILEMLHRP